MSPFGHIGPEPDLVAENRSDNYLSLLAMQALRVAARRGTRPAVAGLPTTVTRTYATPVPYGKQEADPQLAGYPELPYQSKQRRSAFGWDDWQMRRNFGETLHEQEELVSMWGPDAPVVAPPRALRNFTIAFLGFAGLGGIFYAITPERHAVAREYPFSGLITELGGLEANQARTESLTDEE